MIQAPHKSFHFMRTDSQWGGGPVNTSTEERAIVPGTTETDIESSPTQSSVSDNHSDSATMIKKETTNQKNTPANTRP